MENSQHKIEYTRKIGQYRPHFEGKPQSYYQLSGKDISSAVSICFLIVVIFFWLAYAFFMWTSRVSTSNFILVWSIILCIFIPLFMIFAFLGSRNKIQIEQRLIKQALAKQNKLGHLEPKKNRLQGSDNKDFMPEKSIDILREQQ